MRFLPLLILAGLAALTRSGRRAENYPVDQTTGEPLPPYSGRGRPRSYNSKETKRVNVMKGEYMAGLSSLSYQGHVWDPEKLKLEIRDLRLLANDQNNAIVCDGKIEFAGEPGLFTRDRYRCVATPGTTGEKMSYASYIGRMGKRKKKTG